MKTKFNYIFPFIKYVKPTWYFNIKGENGVWLDYRSLSDEDKELVDYDENFSSETVSLNDAAYQILMKGIGVKDGYDELVLDNVGYTIADNYRFIKKYFHFIWLVLILIIRLVSFRNPVKEIVGFYSVFRINRKRIITSYKVYGDYEGYYSPLIKRRPKVSVVIPTLNRYEVLSNVLHDFEKQSYKNFEVIVVDQSDDFRNDYYKGFKLDLKVYHLKQKGVWNARNYAIKISKGEIIALSEDDVRVSPDWLSEHLKCLCFFDTDISAGVFFPQGSSVPYEKSYFKLAEQFATGNAVLYKRVFEKTGLFDKQFEKQRMGDGEFGLRAYLYGVTSINNPKAYCIDVKALTGGFRDFGSWDAFRSKKLFAPKPVPSVLYLTRKYYGNSVAILMLINSVPSSIIPYKYKRNKLLRLLSYPLLITVLPFVIITVIKSWNISTGMIREGAKIEEYSF